MKYSELYSENFHLLNEKSDIQNWLEYAKVFEIETSEKESIIKTMLQKLEIEDLLPHIISSLDEIRKFIMDLIPKNILLDIIINNQPEDSDLIFSGWKSLEETNSLFEDSFDIITKYGNRNMQFKNNLYYYLDSTIDLLHPNVSGETFEKYRKIKSEEPVLFYYVLTKLGDLHSGSNNFKEIK